MWREPKKPLQKAVELGREGAEQDEGKGEKEGEGKEGGAGTRKGGGKGEDEEVGKGSESLGPLLEDLD